MYKQEASYQVWPASFHVAYNVAIALISAMSSKIPLVVSLVALLVMRKLQTREILKPRFASTALSSYLPDIKDYYVFYAVATLGISTCMWMLGLFVAEIRLQMAIVGQRMPGKFNWDESSFCQRWLLARTVHQLVHPYLDWFRGTPMLCSYFRFRGASIGKSVCLYPTGADPYMTEPDLVTIGDFACIDQAALIGHSNVYGEYELGCLEVGVEATLRAHSRLVAGSRMDRQSEMLEHTSVMPGDTIPSAEAWQGWPTVRQQPQATLESPFSS